MESASRGTLDTPGGRIEQSLNRQRLPIDEVDPVDVRGPLEVILGNFQSRDPLRRPAHLRPGDADLEALFLDRAFPADRGERFRHILVYAFSLFVTSPADQRQQFRRRRPRRTMDRAWLPPRPHFLRYEGKIRREQPQDGRQRGGEARYRRCGRPVPELPVTSCLDELQIIVAERPQELLRCIENRRVAVALELRR